MGMLNMQSDWAHAGVSSPKKNAYSCWPWTDAGWYYRIGSCDWAWGREIIAGQVLVIVSHWWQSRCRDFHYNLFVYRG